MLLVPGAEDADAQRAHLQLPAGPCGPGHG